MTKKNEVTADENNDGGWTLSPTNDDRNKSDAMSALSNEMGMMMDMPDDDEDDTIGFEQGEARKNSELEAHYDDDDEPGARLSTLEQSRRS